MRYTQVGVAICVAGASMNVSGPNPYDFDLSLVDTLWLGVNPNTVSFPANNGLCYTKTDSASANSPDHLDVLGYFYFPWLVGFAKIPRAVPILFTPFSIPRVVANTSFQVNVFNEDQVDAATSVVTITAMNAGPTPLQVLGPETPLIVPAATDSPQVSQLPGITPTQLVLNNFTQPMVLSYLQDRYYRCSRNNCTFNQDAIRGAALLYSIPLTTRDGAQNINVSYVVHTPFASPTPIPGALSEGFQYIVFEANLYVAPDMLSWLRTSSLARTLLTTSISYTKLASASTTRQCTLIYPRPSWCTTTYPTYPSCLYKCY